MTRRGQPNYSTWKTEGFPKWLRERLEERGWTQSDLARRTGVSHSIISRWGTENQDPGARSLVRLAEALDLPVTEVLIGAGILEQEPEADPRLLEVWGKMKRMRLTQARYEALNQLVDLFLRYPDMLDAEPEAPRLSRGTDDPPTVLTRVLAVR